MHLHFMSVLGNILMAAVASFNQRIKYCDRWRDNRKIGFMTSHRTLSSAIAL